MRILRAVFILLVIGSLFGEWADTVFAAPAQSTSIRSLPPAKKGAYNTRSSSTTGSKRSGYARPVEMRGTQRSPAMLSPAPGLVTRGYSGQTSTPVYPATRRGAASSPAYRAPARSSGGVSGSSMPQAAKGTGRFASVTSLSFDRVAQACLYKGSDWLLPGQPEFGVGQTLAALSPSFVTGAMVLDPGQLPGASIVSNWAGLRRAVRKSGRETAFDLQLDIAQFRKPADIALYMTEAGALLPAEGWTFLGVAHMARSAPAVLQEAVIEARRQGRKAGAIVDGGNVPSGFDYLIVPYGTGGKDLDQRIAAAKRAGRAPGAGSGPNVIVVSGSLTRQPGAGFAWEKTPAERRRMVIEGSKRQTREVAFAYPLFGPMAGPSRAYNALHDEFMLDTVKRSIEKHNTGSSR